MELEKKRFLWGVSLAWAPWLPLLFGVILGLINAFKGISEQKATGISGLIGGLVEGFATSGLVAVVVVEMSAIVLLVRSFCREQPLRSLFSALCICLSAFTIFLLGYCLWFVLGRYPHAS